MSAAQKAVRVDVMASAVKAAAMAVARAVARAGTAVMAAVANAAKGPTARSAPRARGVAAVKAATNCVKAKHALRGANALSALQVSARRVMRAAKVAARFVVRAATKAAAMQRPSWALRALKPAQNVHPVAKVGVNVVSAAVKAAANVVNAQIARKEAARTAPTICRSEMHKTPTPS